MRCRLDTRVALLAALALVGCVAEDRPFDNPIELDRDEDGLVGAYDCNDDNPEMLACGLNSVCIDDLGCTSGYCLISAGDLFGFCHPASCSDGIQNQAEVNIDCGGPCAGCAVGQFCGAHLDCVSQRCLGGLCVEACPVANTTGADCSECLPQYAGPQCSVCSNPRTDPADCVTCQPQFAGEACAECAEPTVFTGADCDVCVNPLKEAPSCTQCFNPRFVGDACTACVDPTFAGADCNACAHPSVTGETCDECQDPTYTGPRCQLCAQSGVYGDLCDQCNDPKHDPDTGCTTCFDPKYAMPACTDCREGFYGVYCHFCQDVTKTGPLCEDCADSRFQGPNCDECAEGYGGESCRYMQESDDVLLHDGSGQRLWADLSAVPYVARETAATFCADLTVDGFDDFRLPTVDELRSLRDPTQSPPLSDPIVMPALQLSEGDTVLFWTDFYSETQGAGLVLEMVSDVTSIHAANDLANVICVTDFTCGDGHCAGGESPASCSEDCPLTWATCNNGICDIGEDSQSCPRDCGGICGDGLCVSAEVESLCGSDCCVATCDGRACGENGCGGSCGTCAEDEICSQGSCLSLATAVVGSACENETNCGGGTCVQSSVDGLVFSGGYCSVRCSIEGACPSGATCREIDGVPWCVESCTSHDDCRPEDGGYICDQGACWPCALDCEGKICGDDGCGGSCGVCGAEQNCANGQCIFDCTPNCTDVSCGDDGCGGSCGACPDGESCTEGQCVVPCTPLCAGKTCGDDGCGGSCGTCEEGQSCDDAQCIDGCTPNCLDKTCGDDGCGGMCGACGAGFTCSDDGSECVSGSGAGSGCTQIGVTSTSFILQGVEPDFSATYSLELQAIGTGSAQDFLILELYSNMTGTFSLTSSQNDNYQYCDQCFRVFRDYESITETVFFQSSGTVEIFASSSPLDGNVELRLTDLVLQEVAIDATYLSTPVPGGDCFELVPTPLEFDSLQ